jgi:hypothetical protein
MADDEQPETEQQETKDRQGREQAAALDKVTDNVSAARRRAALLLCCSAPVASTVLNHLRRVIYDVITLKRRSKRSSWMRTRSSRWGSRPSTGGPWSLYPAVN